MGKADEEGEAEADEEGETELYFPAGQAMHDVAFVPEIDPNAQGVHLQVL